MQNEPDSPLPFLIHNGIVTDATTPLVSLGDGVIVRGQGAFETLAAYKGVPFLPHAHFARLRRAAAALNLHCPEDTVFLKAIHSALTANQLITAAKSRIRITLTSPPSPFGMSPDTDSESWFVEASPPPPHPATAKVITVPFVRNERGALSGLKTQNYGENVVALNRARESEADEVLFGNTRDQLCEAAWANVFVIHEEHILTPPLSSGCLPGVTRSLVLELFQELGIPVREEDFPMARLPEITGAFLTSSLREIQPVSDLDSRELADLPLLKELREAYRNRVEAACSSAAT